MLRSLHVETMRKKELHGGHEPHQLFQASTIAALLDGAYEGDLTFSELAARGDTGIGTLNGLDGEMIALDGHFYRADLLGRITPVDPEAKTPFAVLTEFDPTFRAGIEGPLDLEALQQSLDRLLDDGLPAAALRIDGDFLSVKARSVPKQHPPYHPLADVVAEQNVFDIGPGPGTLVGFRFPDWSEGIEVGGYHLHFIDRARRRGGHVLDLEIASGTLAAEQAADLCVELPRGVELDSRRLSSSTHEAIERVERGGAG